MQSQVKTFNNTRKLALTEIITFCNLKPKQSLHGGVWGLHAPWQELVAVRDCVKKCLITPGTPCFSVLKVKT